MDVSIFQLVCGANTREKRGDYSLFSMCKDVSELEKCVFIANRLFIVKKQSGMLVANSVCS